MGGARCSYQNCSQKSDKKTHMFHYPVFDKMRCHQWITNAQKLNYLNLKVSQLKNRMVCQHHFTDDCFMNIMKNKLKNNAIPTEYGPFCIKSLKSEADEAQDNKDSEPPINIDDIENEVMPMADRRAHFSVKYGDFLTNDVSEAITLTPEKSTSIMLQDKGMIFNRYDKITRSAQHNQTPYNSNVNKITNLTRARCLDDKKSGNASSFENKLPTSKQLPNPKVVAIDFNELNLNTSGQNQMKVSEISTLPKIKTENTKFKMSSTPIPPSKKVRIISERHISEPVKIPPGELQPVSPSIVIKVPCKKNKSNIEIDNKEIKTFYVDTTHKLLSSQNAQDLESTIPTYTESPQAPVMDQMHLNAYTQPINIGQIGLNNYVIQNADPLRETKLEYLSSDGNCNSQQLDQETGLFRNIDHNIAPNVEFVSGSLTGPSVFTLTDLPEVSTSLTASSYMENASQAPINALLSLDSSVNQEHDSMYVNTQAVVNEKHIIKSSPNKSFKRSKMPPEKLAAIEEKRKYNMKLKDIINSCLNNMEEEPDVTKLTATMKKELDNKKVGEHVTNESQALSQENIIGYFKTRLQRLEDNLLNKIEQNSQKITDLKKAIKQPITKKSTFTQTYSSAEATKRSLYQQVSQYLTPDTNSLIYEELFINQCLSKTEPKRRKRRNINNDKEF